jgi:hypothetical protein
MGVDRGPGGRVARRDLRGHRPRPAADHGDPQGIAGVAAAARLAGCVRVAAALPAADAGSGARRPGPAVVVDAAPPVPPADLSRCAPDVHADQHPAGVQLDPSRSSAHRRLPDGPRSAAAVDRRPVGPRARPPVDHPAVSDAAARRCDRRGPGPPPPPRRTAHRIPGRRGRPTPPPGRADTAANPWRRCSAGDARERVGPAGPRRTHAGHHRRADRQGRERPGDRPGHDRAVAALPATPRGDDLAGNGAVPRTAVGPAARPAGQSRGRSGGAAAPPARVGAAAGLAERTPRRQLAAAVAGQRRGRGRQRRLVASAAGLGAAREPAMRRVDREQPAGLRAAAGRRGRDPPQPAVGADPSSPAGPGRDHDPGPGPGRVRRAGRAVCDLAGRADDGDRGAAPRGDHPRGQGRHPA